MHFEMKTEKEVRRELAILRGQLARTSQSQVELRYELLGCIRQLCWVLGDEAGTTDVPAEWWRDDP